MKRSTECSTSPVRPPTTTRKLTTTQNSIDHLLELLHWKRPDCLGGWLRLEDARLLGERIHSLARSSRWLLLQLQIECAAKLEFATCLQLLRSNGNDTLDGTPDILGLQACLLGNGTVCTCSRHHT